MTVYQDVFKRYEKKYLINSQQLNQLKLLLAPYMKEDSYGTHTIGNLYYDTDSYELIRTSIDQPVYKEKLRLRCYGIPKADGQVFIEIKKKFKGVVYKRRIQMALFEANQCLSTGQYSGPPSQILQEIQWFNQRYRLAPKVYIAYERTAYFGLEDNQLRITFDQNVRFREQALDLSLGTFGRPLMAPDQVLMEIKIPGVMPLWLSQLLTRLEIFPSSFSKYGNCYKHYLMHNTYPKGGIQYA